MARLAIDDDRLRSSTLGSKMAQDIALISKTIRDKGFSKIDFPGPKEFAARLNQAFNLFPQITNKNELEDAKSLLRRYLFLLARHQRSLYSGVRSLGALGEAMNEISSAIGVVPRLKSEPALPANVFLPERIQTAKRKWQEQACANPSRGTAASRGSGCVVTNI